jgi:hypothetical protein
MDFIKSLTEHGMSFFEMMMIYVELTLKWHREKLYIKINRFLCVAVFSISIVHE